MIPVECDFIDTAPRATGFAINQMEFANPMEFANQMEFADPSTSSRIHGTGSSRLPQRLEIQ